VSIRLRSPVIVHDGSDRFGDFAVSDHQLGH
jgi:hypothetical protein